MDKITQLQHKLLTDAQARAQFAKDPAAYLKQHNIDVPAGTQLPAHVPLASLEAAVVSLNAQLAKHGADVHSGDLNKLQNVMGQLRQEAQTNLPAAGRALTTGSGIVAVCAVVVSQIAVAVAGARTNQE